MCETIRSFDSELELKLIAVWTESPDSGQTYNICIDYLLDRTRYIFIWAICENSVIIDGPLPTGSRSSASAAADAWLEIEENSSPAQRADAVVADVARKGAVIVWGKWFELKALPAISEAEGSGLKRRFQEAVLASPEASWRMDVAADIRHKLNVFTVHIFRAGQTAEMIGVPIVCAPGSSVTELISLALIEHPRALAAISAGGSL